VGSDHPAPFLPLARSRPCVALVTRFLSQGRAVVTDRLHGHILSLLLDLPHVVLDNRIGKLRSYYETWTSRCRRSVWADDAETALSRAFELADAESAPP
jgi:exopolysaccharide biosynthesis predicted pyruvyltransferase EpsI